MKLNKEAITDFLTIFKGNQTIHGVHTPDKNVKEGEKARGSSSTVHEATTEDVVMQHLYGKKGLGIVPIDNDNKINFAAIDVDEYPSNPIKYIKILEKANVPAVLFRSKSGGLHIFVFFSDSPEAGKARPYLLQLAGMLGLPKKTEIFPKQSMLSADNLGNWINLPYFNWSKTDRYAYDSKGNQMKLDDALLRIKNARQPFKQFIAAISGAPIALGPPCIQRIYLRGGADEGERNHYLFNCAIYLKARFGEDYEEHLHVLNQNMDNPIGVDRLNKTIIKSHNRNNYAYKCSSPTLVPYCDKEECAKREFGITSSSVSDINFGLLVKYDASTPYYDWEINGEMLRFDSTKQLSSHAEFALLCLEKLGLPQHRMKNEKWVEVLRTAMKNLETREPELEETPDSMWLHKAVEFINNNITYNLEEIKDGKVFLAKKEVVFKANSLIDFLLEQRSLALNYRYNQHSDLIRILLCGIPRNLSRSKYKGRAIVIDKVKLESHLAPFGLSISEVKQKLLDVQEKGSNPIIYLEEHKGKF